MARDRTRRPIGTRPSCRGAARADRHLDRPGAGAVLAGPRSRDVVRPPAESAVLPPCDPWAGGLRAGRASQPLTACEAAEHRRYSALMQDLTRGPVVRHLLTTTSFMLVTMLFQTLYFLVD